MDAAIEKLAGSDRIADELASLAERVRASVALVRGSPFGAGAGVLWSESGLVVTNHHVVPGQWAEVTLADEVPRRARVIARDARLDLAALQLDGGAPAGGQPAARVGDSTRLRVGELVLAVGNPFGERNAVALGMVSGVGGPNGRLGAGEAIRLAMVLRPGNSGGALVDVSGRVVGIPNVVVGPGLALAVPSHVVEQFLARTTRGRSYLGVEVRLVPLPDQLAARSPVAARFGLLLLSVEPESPAERAGLTIGDLLVGVERPDAADDQRDADLLARLARTPAGQPVRLAILRAGELRWVEAALRAA